MKSLVMTAAACGVLMIADRTCAQEAMTASIVVLGEGHVDAAPDTFAMTAEVEGRGSDQAEAVRQMVRVQTAVTESISRLEGLTSAKVTTGLPSVVATYGPDCPGRGVDARCLPVAFVATLSVTLEGMPAERGGDAVSLAAERGARGSRLTRLSNSNSDDLRRQATRAAFADARRQADDIADASGQRIVRVLEVREPDGRSDDPFYGAREMDGERLFVFGLYEHASASTPIRLTPGPLTVNSSLRVTFEIE